MSAKTLNYFPHRFNSEEALNPEAIGNKVGAIGYRTKGMLSLVVDYLTENAGHEEDCIVGTLEAAIEAMNDLQEIKHCIDMATRGIDRNATGLNIVGGKQ